MSRVDLEPDLCLIEELHRADVEATLRGDVDTLKGLMDPECLVLPPDQDPVQGSDFLESLRPSVGADAARILALEQDWQELRIFGDLAWERGIVRYAVRDRSGATTRETQQLIRLLRRQADGSWRVLRAMWHAPRPAN